ncbi:MAG: tyrosine-type recombinase/integrase [Candidatus Aenigmarchaeota archaeon]|nr:tyrosine-type recombinase/integrase [Candidatus Aenigmarchaeota archaeon]
MDMNGFPERINVHGYERQVECQRRLLEESKMRKDNKRLITNFINFCQNGESNIGLSRVRLYYYALRRIGEITKKNFKKINEADILSILAKLKEHRICVCKHERDENGRIKKLVRCNGEKCGGREYSEQTIEDFRKAISKFWRWLYYDKYHGEAPPPIKRIKVKSNNGKKSPEIYSRDEIKKIIDAMPTVRDKAFFSCLYDLQCRVGELLSRQIKHVRYNGSGDLELLIESTKTNTEHWETLFESVANFSTWMRLHPRPDDHNAPLWPIIRVGSGRNPLTYDAARMLFLRVCKENGLREGKKNNIHMLRKSKATHDMADGVPIPYIEARGSWTKGSKALHDCYLLIQDEDKRNAYKKKYKMKVTNGETNNIELKMCMRCDSTIENGAKFCPRCGMPADKKVLAEQKEIRAKVESLIDADMLSEMVKKVVLEELKRKEVEEVKK